MTGTVAIRFDVSQSIGAGHLRRAISLGDELVKRKIPHLFVTPKDSCASAIALGVPKNQLVGFEPNFGEIDWIEKIPELTHVITDICHHEQPSAESKIQQIMQSKRLSVAVVDSMPPYHFQGDETTRPSIVVTPYLDAEKLCEAPHCDQWITGVQYAILDSNYSTLHQSLARNLSVTGDYILICCGNSDPNQISEYILRVLLQHKDPKINVKIVVGKLFEDNRVNFFKTIAEQSQNNVSLAFNQNNIAELICNCGVLIGLVGLIRYESACLGKPSFLVQNHSGFESYLRNFHKSGLGKIFFIQNESERSEFESIVEVLGTVDGFAEKSEPNVGAFGQVDGYGGRRFLDVYLNTTLD